MLYNIKIKNPIEKKINTNITCIKQNVTKKKEPHKQYTVYCLNLQHV